MPKDRIRLEETLELETAAGQVFRIKPVQGGRGVAVLPVLPRAARPRRGGKGGAGRPPSPATLKLRGMFAADAAGDGVRKPAEYVDWLLREEKGLKPATARQRIYKERRDFLSAHPAAKTAKAARKEAKKAAKRGGRQKKAAPSGGGRRGRKPSAALEKLRAKLEKDAAAGKLAEPKAYVDWVLKHDRSIGLKQARSMVYRERRAVA